MLADRKQCVLVLDDDRLPAARVARSLVDAGFTVRILRDLAQAEQAADDPADVLLVDGGRPAGDDVHVARLLARPVLRLSSEPQVELDAIVARVRDLLTGMGAGDLPPPRKPTDSTARVRAQFLRRFVLTAWSRLRRAQALAGQGAKANADHIAREMHTLVGEASLLGESELATRAEAVRIAIRRLQRAEPVDSEHQLALAELQRAIERLHAGGDG
jgi:hypothetical protein